MQRWCVVGVFLWCFFAVLFVAMGKEKETSPSGHNNSNVIFPVGEELLYEVRWWKFKLGTIRTKILGVRKGENGVQTNARVTIDSYSWVPFVNLHVVFEITMDGECYSEVATSLIQENAHWEFVRYRYDRQHSLLVSERGYRLDDNPSTTTIQRVDTLPIHPQTQDGLSLIYFARKHLRCGRTLILPTIADSLVGRTVLNFYNAQTSVWIDALPYAVDVVEFDGRAEFKGIFGLTGYFKGWFSNDEAHVPISATMNVVLGTVQIELKEWHRGGWDPPRYKK